MQHLLTFDIEEWYHSNLPSLNGHINFANQESRLEEPTYRILEMLEETQNTATFFVLGDIVQQHKTLIGEIYNAGHEIASHGFSHRLVYEMTPAQFEEDLKKSKNLLEDIIGDKVWGFRAPSWSVPEDAHWYWEILAKLEIRYDSSLFPFKTFLYGSNSHPRTPHSISIGNYEILEWPPSVAKIFGKRVPFSGGFYFRVLPSAFIRHMIRSYVDEFGTSVVLYLHPWELDSALPKVKMGWKDHFIHHTNVRKCEKKLYSFLKNYNFTNFRNKLATKKL